MMKIRDQHDADSGLIEASGGVSSLIVPCHKRRASSIVYFVDLFSSVLIIVGFSHHYLKPNPMEQQSQI